MQPALSGSNDAFVAYVKTTAAAPSLVWSTYLGGSATEKGTGIVSDATNNIYVVGNTTSPDNISSGISYANSYSGSQDAFLEKIDVTGALVWGTYFGGTSTDAATGVCVDAYNNITIAGSTQSSSIATTGAYQTALSGTADAYISKYNSLGQQLYTTYYGKTGNEQANGVIADALAASTSSIIIAGYTSSGTATGFASAGAAQTTYGGGISDAFVTKFLRDTIVGFRQAFVDTILCPGGSFTVHDTVNLNFAPGNTFTVQLSDATGSFAAPVTIGSVTSSTFGPIACTIPAGTPVGAGYRIRIKASNPAYTSVDNNINISIMAALPPFSPTANTPVCVGLTLNLGANPPYSATGYSWAGPAAFASALQNPSIAGVTLANAGTYSVTVTHTGCPSSVNTISVVVNNVFPPAPIDSANAPICMGSDLYLFTRSGASSGTYTYSWSGPAGFTSTAQNPVILGVTPTEAGTYTAIDTLDGCPSVGSPITIVISPTDTPNITITVSPNDTVCAGQLVHFTTTVTNGGFSPGYQWMTGSSTPVVGAVLDNYASAFFSNGTPVWCHLTPGAGCHDKPTDSSNVIVMTVLNNTPVVHVTIMPDSFIAPGTTVTLTSTTAGTMITGYQWYVNNVPVAGATTTTLVLHSVTHNDTVRLEVSSIAICANIGVSNYITVRPTTGVTQIASLFGNIELLPNPNDGMFAVKGIVQDAPGASVTMNIFNAIGQLVYSTDARIQNGVIDQSFDLKDMPAGMYILKVSKDGESKVFRFIHE